MYYVYSLSFNGLIYYIGVTKQPDKRYINHYCDTCSAVYKVNRYVLNTQSLLCDMNLIHAYKSKRTAFMMEEYYIKAYRKMYFLVNDLSYTYFEHLINYEDINKIKRLSNCNIHINIAEIKKQQLILNELCSNKI